MSENGLCKNFAVSVCKQHTAGGLNSICFDVVFGL